MRRSARILTVYRVDEAWEKDERQATGSCHSSSLYQTLLQQGRNPANKSVSGIGNCALLGLQDGRMPSAYPSGCERSSSDVAWFVALNIVVFGFD